MGEFESNMRYAKTVGKDVSKPRRDKRPTMDIREGKTIDFQKIAHEINTQDNRMTQDPLFCVYQKRKIFGIDSDYHEVGYEKDDDGKIHSYIEVDEFINAHFTEKAANEHLRINGHNLYKPFVYVTSLWRCKEMIAIRDALANNRKCGL